MKILMFRPSYYPEISGGTHLGMDLVEDIINAGHEVILVTPSPWRTDKETRLKYKNKKVETQYNGRLTIYRVYVSANEKSIFSRALRMLFLTLGMLIRAWKVKGIDLLMSHSMPVFIGPTSVLFARFKKVPVLYLENDVASESLISTGVVQKGLKKKVLYSFGKILEKISLKGSNFTITISDLFRKRNIESGLSKEKIGVIYNWIDTEKIFPISRDDNYLFDRLNLNRDMFYVTYCGNIGLPQNLEIFIDAAKDLQHIKEIQFVIIGNGVRKEAIRGYIEDSKTTNIKLFPLQPLEEAASVYSIGDVGIVIGKKGTSKNGFPSKTWTMMAAGQAIISCFDLDSELSKCISDGKCGIPVQPDSSDELKEAILEMYNNREFTEQCKVNSREYVTQNYSRKIATKKYLEVIERLK
ncbi:glycosyltransferase family 4 protein [Bacillus sp. SD075]|uniref:glycosyltransferase family 4 protein n=1 Tax=Bacillus sp. SD075 TaxID=2781732 RepID=UPI001A97A432|nr:glycosyltransferase family 4 protein [Bacillus sp. SD075]MBO0996438.1 glycosyltransferase family 4 protein [Bacillus sp. SD075]